MFFLNHRYIKLFISILAILFLTGAMVSCDSGGKSDSDGESAEGASTEENAQPLPSPFESGELVVLVNNSFTSFFIYRGQPKGFEYEMLKYVCDEMGLKLKVKIIKDGDHILDSLRMGHGHIAAANLTISKDRMELVDFTEPVFSTRQMLVQKKPDNWRKMNPYTISKALIRDPLELEGKTVTVRKNTSYFQRLVNLMNETNTDLKIDTVPGDMETELLIEAVSNGEIDYTVADENMATIIGTFYGNVDIEMPLSLSQPIGWAVNKGNKVLYDSLNSWIDKNKGSMKYNWIYKKYFELKKGEQQLVKNEIPEVKEGAISPYDDIIRKHAGTIGWDWRFLAAQIRKESGFNPETVSWAGAKGLMQLMPTTASRYKLNDPFNPEQNIMAGVKYLKWLEKFWEERVPDSLERSKFILASYNTGQGHVLDAVRLAEKYDKDPQKWEDNVETMLKKKSQKKYFDDPVVKHGYCRGIEPVTYVREILEYFELYKAFQDVKDETG